MTLDKLYTLQTKIGYIVYRFNDDPEDDILVDELLVMDYDGAEFVVDIEAAVCGEDGCTVGYALTWDEYVEKYIEDGLYKYDYTVLEHGIR